MTPVFAHWAWLFPHLLLLVQLLQCVVGATATAAGVPPSSLGNTIEADLIFPHEGGRYTNSPNGIPVVIGIQNADAASRFGFKLRWQLLEAPTRRGEVSVMVGGGPYPSLRSGDTRTDVNATAPASFPWATTAKITGQLSPGNYTLQWNLGVVPYCEFGEQTAKYEYGHEVTRGTIRFSIVDDAAVSPPRSLLSTNGDGRDGSEVPPGRKRNGTENVSDGNDNCANLMGVVSYVSTAPWSRAAETQRWPGDPRWSRVLNATTGVCAVTASPTFTPGPFDGVAVAGDADDDADGVVDAKSDAEDDVEIVINAEGYVKAVAEFDDGIDVDGDVDTIAQYDDIKTSAEYDDDFNVEDDVDTSAEYDDHIDVNINDDDHTDPDGGEEAYGQQQHASHGDGVSDSTGCCQQCRNRGPDGPCHATTWIC
ncbi:hypothetical protein PG993_012613 [Apiospora rasikravindrae]|uniref:DUF7136 domain-containing protein n=1 Tax=Apiospora rasikravindrae TaxID=990691 RepID=A0ABR1S482_9PEZI